MCDRVKPLKPNEIVSLTEGSIPILIPHPTFKVEELAKAIINQLKYSDNIYKNAINKTSLDSSAINPWYDEGMKCEVLTCDGKGWQTGKVRLTLEFIPDAPEVEAISASNQIPLPQSPLDDLRQMMNDNS